MARYLDIILRYISYARQCERTHCHKKHYASNIGILPKRNFYVKSIRTKPCHWQWRNLPSSGGVVAFGRFLWLLYRVHLVRSMLLIYKNIFPLILINKFSLSTLNKYPVGTTMRPRLAVELTDEYIFWGGLKHFHCDFCSGFTTLCLFSSVPMEW